MARIFTAADINPTLSAALGRFAQAAAQLESAVQSAIIRLLPITTGIGNVAFAANSAQRNREILEGLLSLPEVPIDTNSRNRLKDALPKIKQFQEDRNRLLHNVVVERQEKITILRSSKNGYVAHDTTIEDVNSWAIEALELAELAMSVPHAVYDFSSWDKEFPTYTIKNWPGRSS